MLIRDIQSSAADHAQHEYGIERTLAIFLFVSVYVESSFQCDCHSQCADTSWDSALAESSSLRTRKRLVAKSCTLSALACKAFSVLLLASFPPSRVS